MTRNPIPADLPAPVDDIDAGARPLVLDMYLSRHDLMERIANHLYDDPDSVGHLALQGKAFSHEGLATIYRRLMPDIADDADAIRLRRDVRKCDMIDHLGDQFGFTTLEAQDEVLKSQLIHLLVVLVTGDQPTPFVLPSDPPGMSDPPGGTRPSPQGAD